MYSRKGVDEYDKKKRSEKVDRNDIKPGKKNV